MANGARVAWLPSCSVGPEHAGLVPVADDRWGMEITTVAMRDRAVRRNALDRVWSRLTDSAQP